MEIAEHGIDVLHDCTVDLDVVVGHLERLVVLFQHADEVYPVYPAFMVVIYKDKRALVQAFLRNRNCGKAAWQLVRTGRARRCFITFRGGCPGCGCPGSACPRLTRRD